MLTHFRFPGTPKQINPARWSSGLRLRPLTPATRVRISYGSPLWATKEKKIVGVYSDEGPPVPIPNTAVKLISAENTWGAAPWEDRATPTFLYASIAQSVEHAAVNRGVTGSSPVWGAKRKSRPYGLLSDCRQNPSVFSTLGFCFADKK